MGSYHTEKFKSFRARWKKAIVYASGGKCQCCGYDKTEKALEFHHINPDEKEFTLGQMKSSPTMNSSVVAELKKCILVCSNCHKEIHAGITHLPPSYSIFDLKLYETCMSETTKIFPKLLSSRLVVDEVRDFVRDHTYSETARKFKVDPKSMREFCKKHGFIRSKKIKLSKPPSVPVHRSDLSTSQLYEIFERNNRNYCAVSRIVKISDNAIRKRFKRDGLI